MLRMQLSAPAGCATAYAILYEPVHLRMRTRLGDFMRMTSPSCN
jgi:hypothetical protein